MTVDTPDWVRAIPPSALDRKLGIEIVDWDPACLVATMPVGGNTRLDGSLHGGAVSSLVESIGSHAAVLSLGREARVVGIELSVSHHATTNSGDVRATCRLQDPAPDTPLRSMLVEVHDQAGGLLTSARLTCLATASHRTGQDGSSPA